MNDALPATKVDLTKTTEPVGTSNRCTSPHPHRPLRFAIQGSLWWGTLWLGMFAVRPSSDFWPAFKGAVATLHGLTDTVVAPAGEWVLGAWWRAGLIAAVVVFLWNLGNGLLDKNACPYAKTEEA